VVLAAAPFIPSIGGLKALGKAASHGDEIVKGAGKIVSRGRRHSSRALARALERAGHVKPPGSAAHHIVAGGAKRAARARAVLEKFGIHIDDAANGVFLPSNVHRRIHTNAYYDAVNEALKQATTKSEALQILRAIGQRLANGEFR
ncbi:hypothetical protein D6779_06175, partial [Candidatus Parcubacteria bacterium]